MSIVRTNSERRESAEIGGGLTFDLKKKWVATDGWRGYEQPKFAVAGASDTGTWSDSPAPSGGVEEELKGLEAYLKENNIRTKEVVGSSSNDFMAKRWIVVPPAQYKEAKKLADEYLKKNEKTTEYIHDAD